MDHILDHVPVRVLDHVHVAISSRRTNLRPKHPGRILLMPDSASGWSHANEFPPTHLAAHLAVNHPT